MERGDNTRSHGKEREEHIAIDIREMLDGLPTISNDCCIFRVPNRMRKANDKAFTPQMVSIGPFHRGEEHLQAMEELKPRYLQSLLNRPEGMNLDICIKKIKEWEEKARSYYSESIKLTSDEFVKMILLDGCFIIEVFWRLYYLEAQLWRLYNLEDEQMSDYLNSQTYVNGLCNDFILLENQLPFFVLEGLFDLVFHNKPISFFKLCITSFVFTSITRVMEPSFSSCRVKHFVDLLRLCHLPSLPRSRPKGRAAYVSIRNATELHEAGIKFKKASSKRLVDIALTNKEVMEIPRLAFNYGTELLLRNLTAFEQFHCPFDSYILDYTHFMNDLIDSAKDVDLLIQNEILYIEIGDTSTVAALFNNLTSEMLLWSPNYYFHDMSEKLNEYCGNPRHKWKATLKRDYFSTPWRTASTVAAFILLGLTLIQTITSLLSL